MDVLWSRSYRFVGHLHSGTHVRCERGAPRWSRPDSWLGDEAPPEIDVCAASTLLVRSLRSACACVLTVAETDELLINDCNSGISVANVTFTLVTPSAAMTS